MFRAARASSPTASSRISRLASLASVSTAEASPDPPPRHAREGTTTPGHRRRLRPPLPCSPSWPARPSKPRCVEAVSSCAPAFSEARGAAHEALEPRSNDKGVGDVTPMLSVSRARSASEREQNAVVVLGRSGRSRAPPRTRAARTPCGATPQGLARSAQTPNVVVGAKHSRRGRLPMSPDAHCRKLSAALRSR